MKGFNQFAQSKLGSNCQSSSNSDNLSFPLSRSTRRRVRWQPVDLLIQLPANEWLIFNFQILLCQSARKLHFLLLYQCALLFQIPSSTTTFCRNNKFGANWILYLPSFSFLLPMFLLFLFDFLHLAIGFGM